ncbi:MAG: phosphatase PAP2 family protein [Lachnoclostridium sp.]|nr:phosphatase PAP2 family protein [Lachnoclostridium sp.]
MKKLSAILLCILSVTLSMMAHERPDSVATLASGADSISRTEAFPTIPVVTAAGTAGLAALSRQLYPHSGFANASPGVHTSRGTSVLQFAPLAFPWVMKATGHPTRSSWGRMALSDATSLALTGAMVYSLKNIINTPRPDGTDLHSFPSGHAAWAFAGATIMERELGWSSEWYTIAAYAFATGIAVERVIDRHHYPTDVVAGAGLGILATRLGYFIGDIIMGNNGIDSRSQQEINRNNDNLSYFSLETGMSLPLGPVDFGNGVKIIRLPAIAAGLRGGFAIEDNWGLAVEAGLQSTPLLIDVRHDRTNVANLTALGLMLSPYYRYALSHRISLSGEAGIGYYKNFNVNSIDHAITGGSGSIAGRLTVGAIMRFSDHFSLKASVGCQLSRYNYSIKPSTAYHNDLTASRSGLTPALLLNISSRYEF